MTNDTSAPLAELESQTTGLVETIGSQEGSSRRSGKDRRILTIDTMKGMSMVMILYCHFGWGWRGADWFVFFRFQWLVLDFFGPIMFLTMSVLGVMASHADELARGVPVKHTLSELLRISALFLIGEAINLFNLSYLGIFHLTAWNIVTAIAMISLLIPYILRLKPWIRLLLVACIVVAYFPLVDWLMGPIDAAGISHDEITAGLIMADPRTAFYWLFFHHGQMAPLFSWLIVPLVTSILFSPLISIYKRTDAAGLHRELKRIAVAGVIMLVGGIVFGSRIFPGFANYITTEMNMPGDLYFHWPWTEGIPYFLSRHVPQYLFYMLGIVCIIFSLLGELQLVRGRLSGRSKVNALGKLSLTAFLMSHMPLIFAGIDLSMPVFFMAFLPLIVLILYLFGIWVHRFGTKGSIEWLIGVYTTFVIKKLASRGKRGP